MVEFDSATELVDAARQVRDAGYVKTDAFSPFPLHEIDEALGIKRSVLPYLIFAGGITGLMTGIGLQYFVHVHRPEQWFCRACEPKQLIDQRVDPVNLVHDQAGKGFAEIRLVVALRKELSESLDRNQRVLNLVCHSG